MALIATLTLAMVTPTGSGGRDLALAAPVGQGFNLNASDLRFILKQIKIAEAHVANTTPATGACGALLGSGPDQIPANGVGVTLPWGLRTVNGSCNNIVAGQSTFGTADQKFPRLVPSAFTGPYLPSNSPSSVVFDSEPRLISNLIVDQTAGNPAAVSAAGDAPEVTTSGAFFIPNVAPDVGLSAPYNSWFTLFGQFFDHGLDLVNKGGNGTVIVPLHGDDPLFDDPAPDFMVLTRASHVNGEANNQTSPWVDQSQTYTSHPSHQVFLREYELVGGVPVGTGRLITGPGGGMADWTAVKEQARTVLGIELSDRDVLSVPTVATDPYGRFVRGPNGFPRLVLTAGGFVEGNLASPITTAGVLATGHAFLDDIAHHAAPGASQLPDADPGTTDDFDPDTYDDEMLGAHFIAGDGRVNENIGLTTVHHIFHSEHNRLRDDIDSMLQSSLFTAAERADWETTLRPGGWDYAERVFQAARFVTEMEYQHLAFEEFIRKVQPMVNLFGEGGTGYHTDINPAITAEFAHAVYRFGHSMLTETVDRIRPDGTHADMDLLDAFLNPPSFLEGTTGPENAAGNIVRGMTRQVGNELDELVTEALRNRLLGLPLDLATLNIARGRDTGIPTLNAARRHFYSVTDNSALAPYTSWADFSLSIKHPDALANFVAAYGTHSTVTSALTASAKRAAAQQLIVDASNPDPLVHQDPQDFLNSTGVYASLANGVTTTGVDAIDLWVGGLAEKGMVFGGLLGPTFNYVFEYQMESLQDGDRFYYLSRTVGLNLLTQLEGNSFSELIQRNTDVTSLPADSFSRPDYVFEVANLGTSGPILNDPATDYNESTLLIREPNGTIRYAGPAHVVFNGSAGADKVRASEGDDTLRGNDGNDRLEGGDGADNLIGGLGEDILTDLFGDDVIKGGDGNDAISSGQGFGGDLNQGGLGDDFVVGGNDITETFGGPGNDFVFAGDAEDTVFGDDGDDWIEGGKGPFNLLQGDNGAPFQDDPNEPGHDVIDGDGGEQDFDAEGGDDIMFAGPGIQRSEGMLGFDWVGHRGDPQPANSEMLLTGLLPPSVETNRDRFDLVESLSGWTFDDILRGDDRVAADMVGHELDAAGIARVTGLAALLPAGAQSFTGGNIILGGEGSDLIEGRGGDDLIDGDSWLNAQLRAPNVSTPDPLDTSLFESMSGIRVNVFAGSINPGDISIFRSIVTTNPGGFVDTAVFSDVQANYDITENPDGSVEVSHLAGAGIDGTDTLLNMERLTFLDGSVELGVLFNTAAQGSVDINDTTPVEDQLLTAAAAVTDADGIDPGTVITITWQAEFTPGTWTGVSVGNTFTPTDGVVGFRLRAVATFADHFGVPEQVIGDPTGIVANVNDAPTGAAIISNNSPEVGQPMSVDVSSIADDDGLPATLNFQWQRGTTPIAGATSGSFVPTGAQIGQTLRVVVTFTDLHGTAEQVISASTGTVLPPPFPLLQLSDTSLAFGTRARLTPATTQLVTVTNNGNALLLVSGVTTTGTGAASFSPVNNCTAPVAPGDSCQVGASFLTTAVAGAKVATLNIASNAPASPATVSLSGTLFNNSAPTGLPAISDTTPVENQSIVATQGTIADANGLTGAVFSYQWQQNSVGGAGAYVDIIGANTDQFTVTNAQVNRRLRVRVTFVDDLGTTEIVASAGTQVVGDVFVGTVAAESWTGTAQVDTASGGGGADTLSALAGNDTISGDGGDDNLNAGAGNDVIQFNGTGDGFDIINGGTNTDRIEALSDGTVIGLRSITGVESITANGHVGVTIAGNGAANNLNFSAVALTGISFIDAGAGADTIGGSAAADDIRGGAGNDILNGNGGVDRISGDANNDTITPGAGNDFVVFAPGSGTDTIVGFDANVVGGQDLLDISAFGITAATFNASVIRQQVGTATRVTIGTVIINLNNNTVANVTIADFVL